VCSRSSTAVSFASKCQNDSGCLSLSHGNHDLPIEVFLVSATAFGSSPTVSYEMSDLGSVEVEAQSCVQGPCSATCAGRVPLSVRRSLEACRSLLQFVGQEDLDANVNFILEVFSSGKAAQGLATNLTNSGSRVTSLIKSCTSVTRGAGHMEFFFF
jgi:hypothetical protein